jgi:hypothetical protein
LIAVVVRLDLEFAFGLFGHQVGAHEGIEVAVEDPVHVAHLEFRAVVLDHAVRLQDVGPNLAAEGDVELGFVKFVGVLLALLNLQVVESRTEHLHGELSEGA